MKAIADALGAFLEVGQRLLIWIALALLLFTPGSFPLLDRFVFESAEINLLGQKIKVIDTKAMGGSNVQGLTIRDGRLLFENEDMGLLPGKLSSLRNEVASLQSENATLARELQDAAQKLATLAKNPTGSAPETQAQLERLAQSTEQAAAAVQTPSPAPPPSPVQASFAVMVSSDTTLGAGGAADEITNATKWAAAQQVPPRVRVFLRNGYYATALVFGSREAAQQALPALRKVFRADAYTTDLRAWCPAGWNAEPRIMSGTAVIDCRF